MRLRAFIAAGVALLLSAPSVSAQQLDARVSLNLAGLVNQGFGAFELGRRFGNSGASGFIEVGKWWIEQYPVCLLGPCDARVITESASSGLSFGLPREKKGWRVEASASAVLFTASRPNSGWTTIDSCGR